MNDPQSTLEQRIQRLAAAGASATLRDNHIGLEKESLRVAPGGTLAQSPHPVALGAALTHPCITTDFSESLLEFITPPLTNPREVLDFLRDIHLYVHEHLGDELLWGTSMPCVIDGAGRIPLARYGTSNAGLMKTVYRRGLGNRYGRTMQVIAGIHFNFSFSDDFWALVRAQDGDGEEPGFRSTRQMGMLRNLQRIGWIVPYLFGASPAICRSFIHGQEHDLESFDDHTLYYPHATSLRMGDIGYQNQQTQGTGLKASYDTLDAYVRCLTWAIETPCPQYEEIGVKVGDRYEQLNANVLQIENEYYSTVRPKQITEWMERPTLALQRRGIRYVELRSPDINLFEPVGICLDELLFLEVMMLHSLLSESPCITPRERRDIDTNQVLTAHRGREPGLQLSRDGTAITLQEWAQELLGQMQGSAELLDGGAGGAHSASLQRQLEKVLDPQRTPSARVLRTMRERKQSFFQFAQQCSLEHREHFRSLTLDPGRRAYFDQLARESLARQHALEEADDLSFDEFLRRYFAQELAPATSGT